MWVECSACHCVDFSILFGIKDNGPMFSDLGFSDIDGLLIFFRHVGSKFNDVTFREIVGISVALHVLDTFTDGADDLIAFLDGVFVSAVSAICFKVSRVLHRISFLGGRASAVVLPVFDLTEPRAHKIF